MKEKITRSLDSLLELEDPVYGMKIPVSNDTGQAAVIEYGDLLKKTC